MDSDQVLWKFFNTTAHYSASLCISYIDGINHEAPLRTTICEGSGASTRRTANPQAGGTGFCRCRMKSPRQNHTLVHCFKWMNCSGNRSPLALYQSNIVPFSDAFQTNFLINTTPLTQLRGTRYTTVNIFKHKHTTASKSRENEEYSVNLSRKHELGLVGTAKGTKFSFTN